MAPASRYTRSGGTGALVGDQVADDRVLELFLDGHTIVLQGLHRLWPPLIDFAGALTTDLGHPVQVNAYVTPRVVTGLLGALRRARRLRPAGGGGEALADPPPVLDAPARDQPWTDHRAAVAARAEESPVIDAVLRPGDALYLPRGYLHAAEALGGVTCHLTVGVHPVTRQHLLDALLAIAVDVPTLRSSLPMGVDLGDPAAVEDDLRATVAALTELLRTVSAVEVATRLGDRLVDSNRPAPVAPLAQAAALEGLSGDSVLVSRGHLRHLVTMDGDEVVVRVTDRTLRLPARAAKAVRALLDGDRLRVADLPGLDLPDALELARRLVREVGRLVIDRR